MASNSDSLYGIAAELLTRAAAILAGTPAGAPANQYVSQGPPAYDCCNLLTVHAGVLVYGGFRRGADGTIQPDPRMHVVPTVPLTITVLRCANQQALPSGGLQIQNAKLAAINQDSQVVYRDGWCLFNGINKAQRDGSLFAGWPCRPFEIDGALPLSPDGGCLGWTLDVHVALNGFDPAGA